MSLGNVDFRGGISCIDGQRMESRQLTIESKLQDLELERHEIGINVPGRHLIEAFEKNLRLSGAVLTDHGEFRGLLSRHKFLNVLSRPYGLELFSNRPLASLLSLVQVDSTVFSGDTLIFAASQQCLSRRSEFVYEPLVVQDDSGHYQILDFRKLLLAQAQIYKTMTEMLDERNLALREANVEIKSLNDRLQAENLRMNAELSVARQMQLMVLPKANELEAIEGLDIAGFMEATSEVGGDYYDVLEQDGIVTIGIGDVVGHGLGSGLLMMMTQTAVRTLKEIGEQDLVNFLGALNRIIYKNVQRMNIDKDMTISILNYFQGQLHIIGQHEEVLIVRSDGTIERIDTMDLGVPIGLTEDITDLLNCETINLNSGDGVVLYSDGITESYNIDKVQYGMNRFCQTVSQNWAGNSAENVKASVVRDVWDFIGQQKIFDDITLLVLKQQ